MPKTFRRLARLLLAALCSVFILFLSPAKTQAADFSLSVGYQTNVGFDINESLSSENETADFFYAYGGVFVEPALRWGRHELKFPVSGMALRYDSGQVFQLSMLVDYAFHFRSGMKNFDPYVYTGLGINFMMVLGQWRGGIEDESPPPVLPLFEIGFGMNYWLTPKLAFNAQVPFRTSMMINEFPLRVGVNFNF